MYRLLKLTFTKENTLYHHLGNNARENLENFIQLNESIIHHAKDKRWLDLFEAKKIEALKAANISRIECNDDDEEPVLNTQDVVVKKSKEAIRTVKGAIIKLPETLPSFATQHRFDLCMSLLVVLLSVGIRNDSWLALVLLGLSIFGVVSSTRNYTHQLLVSFQVEYQQTRQQVEKEFRRNVKDLLSNFQEGRLDFEKVRLKRKTSGQTQGRTRQRDRWITISYT